MKKLSIVTLLLSISLVASAQTIEHTYHFDQPTFQTIGDYEQISLPNCLSLGKVGKPMLPWQSVCLILPQGQEAKSIQVELSDFVELEGNFNLFPAQKPRPVSNERQILFAKDEALYRSEDMYPSTIHSSVSTQYLNGVSFAFGGFTPVQYVPATGNVRYARTARVSITTSMSRDDHSRMLWLTPENEASINRLAQNPDMLSTYAKHGREMGGYDMLVISSEEWLPRFGDYLNLYNDKGIRTRIVSLEEIYATIDGRDEQEQIRNYIIQEYEDNGIQMVNLGGDVSIVPYRSLYCFAQEGDEDQLPADMYYACLDGTLNDDGDDRWGEVGEDDLLPELGIGRLPFNNEAQFETIMHKTFSYQLEPVMGEFTSPIFGAEHLGDGYYGSDDMERLIGENNDFDYTTYCYPENYNFKRYYASETLTWSGSAFRDVIGTGGQYVHHVGHANTDVVAGWDLMTLNDNYFANNDGTSHNYMLFHSHGCICGNFPSNCILEKMITIPTGFVLTTGNSRYGWYVPWGDGMAAHIHREFIDAYCHDHIPSVGMALREAKIVTAPWVTMPIDEGQEENGYMRWNLYCLNVLGDAALYPWFEEPFTPDVVYPHGIMQGSLEIDGGVGIAGTGRDLDNFTVSLYKDGDLIARDVTTSNGGFTLYPDNPSQLVGDMDLIVTGQSAWPQRLTIKGFTADEPYLYTTAAVIIGDENGLLEPGETIHMDLGIINSSNVNLSNVEVTVSCDDSQIEIINGQAQIPLIEANSDYSTSYLNTDGYFVFVVSDAAIDRSRLILDVEMSAEGHTWHSEVPIYLSAPVLQFGEITVDDSQGDQNGFIDQGEIIKLLIQGGNVGHAMAPNTYLTASCDDERIMILQDEYPIGNVDLNGVFNAEIQFIPDDNILGGTIFNIIFELHCGSYVTSYDYSFAVGVAVETFESGDFSFLEWQHEGDAPWIITDSDAHTGSFSARSGAIADNQVSRLIVYANILNDGEISFWFRTSTEYHKDYFAFYIDNRRQGWWSGETDWTYASYDFVAGSHRFVWLYDKSLAGEAGEDCAWIDDITFPRTCIITKVEEIMSMKESALYPNPTSGSFTIELDEESNINIFNILGQNILSLNNVSGNQQINLDEAPKGLYFVQIQGGKQTETKKILVK